MLELMRSSSRFLASPFLALTALVAAARGQLAEPVGIASRARSDVEGVERVLVLAQKDNRVYQLERRIAKEHPKRLTGSLSSEAALEWARAELASYGLDARSGASSRSRSIAARRRAGWSRRTRRT